MIHGQQVASLLIWPEPSPRGREGEERRGKERLRVCTALRHLLSPKSDPGDATAARLELQQRCGASPERRLEATKSQIFVGLRGPHGSTQGRSICATQQWDAFVFSERVCVCRRNNNEAELITDCSM